VGDAGDVAVAGDGDAAGWAAPGPHQIPHLTRQDRREQGGGVVARLDGHRRDAVLRLAEPLDEELRQRRDLSVRGTHQVGFAGVPLVAVQRPADLVGGGLRGAAGTRPGGDVDQQIAVVGRLHIAVGQFARTVAVDGLDGVGAGVFHQRRAVLEHDGAVLADVQAAALGVGRELQLLDGVGRQVGGLHGDVAGVDHPGTGVAGDVEHPVDTGPGQFPGTDRRHRQAAEPGQRVHLVDTRHGHVGAAAVRRRLVVGLFPRHGVALVQVVGDAGPRGADPQRSPRPDAGDAVGDVRPAEVGGLNRASKLFRTIVAVPGLPHLHRAVRTAGRC
jgi:hypothetical protein